MADETEDPTKDAPARPGPQKFEPRLCLVLRRMADIHIDHYPGEVIMWDGPETDAIRELTPQEIEDRERVRARDEEPEERAEPGTDAAFQESARETVIVAALHTLAHEEATNWTESGQPLVTAVNNALIAQGASNPETSRAEIRKFAPDFRRITG